MNSCHEMGKKKNFKRDKKLQMSDFHYIVKESCLLYRDQNYNKETKLVVHTEDLLYGYAKRDIFLLLVNLQ